MYVYILYNQSVLPKGWYFTANSWTKAAVLPNGRSSTAYLGTKVAVLLGMNRCDSFQLLSAPHSHFDIWTDLKSSERIPGTPAWRWGAWTWLTAPCGLHRNSPKGLNISSIRVFDQIRDPEIQIIALFIDMNFLFSTRLSWTVDTRFIRKVSIASRDGMTTRTGVCVRSSKDGICENNAVQFQSCGGSSYCTELGENGRTDIVSRQLRDSWRQSRDGMVDVLAGKRFHSVVDPRRECTWVLRGMLEFCLDKWTTMPPMHGLLFCFWCGMRPCFIPSDNREVLTTVTSWLQILAVEPYDTGIQTLVHRYDKYLNKGGDYIEK